MHLPPARCHAGLRSNCGGWEQAPRRMSRRLRRRTGGRTNEERPVRTTIPQNGTQFCTFTNRFVPTGSIKLRKVTLGATATTAFVISPDFGTPATFAQSATTTEEGEGRARGGRRHDGASARHVRGPRDDAVPGPGPRELAAGRGRLQRDACGDRRGWRPGDADARPAEDRLHGHQPVRPGSRAAARTAAALAAALAAAHHHPDAAPRSGHRRRRRDGVVRGPVASGEPGGEQAGDTDAGDPRAAREATWSRSATAALPQRGR